MIYIGMEMNGFTIAAASRQYRAGRGEGTVILGIREFIVPTGKADPVTVANGGDLETEWVVAWVGLDQTESREPATWWDGGIYLRSDHGHDAIAAAKRFMSKSGLQAIADYPS